MLLCDMMKRFRFVLGHRIPFIALMAFALGLMGVNARAQSTYQNIAFSVQGQFETATNDVPSEPNTTFENLHLLLFTSANVVHAIAVDVFGTEQWTNWAAAGLLRRVNLVTGEERIYLSRGGTNVIDVSSFFSGSYVSNFMSGTRTGFPSATNNFTADNPDPYQPLFSGTNGNYFNSAGLYFISLNTTNLKMNLVGANFSFLGNGILHNFKGVQGGTNYSGEVQNEVISVVGTYSWNRSTNLLNVGSGPTDFYSGPARGNVTVRDPSYSTLALPATEQAQ
jgi:hypothetical protein